MTTKLSSVALVGQKPLFPHGHVLLSGFAGSGKTRLLHQMISESDEMDGNANITVITPRVEEYQEYTDIVDLVGTNKAENTLEQLVADVRYRYDLFNQLAKDKNVNITNIHDYRTYVDDPNDWLSYHVVIIDDYALLQERFNENIEQLVKWLVQFSNKVGFIVVLATQFASADILSPAIKNNMVNRICTGAISSTQSQIALDVVGAELMSPDEIAIKQPYHNLEICSYY